MIAYVALGGFFGAAARYLVNRWIQSKAANGFPYGTLIVNLSGSLLLGFFWGLSLSGEALCFLCTGFLGAFTTFSTFKLEIVKMLKENKRRPFYAYMAISYVFGILLAYGGYLIGSL